jgi:phospholipase/lecithinase/hemolysin
MRLIQFSKSVPAFTSDRLNQPLTESIGTPAIRRHLALGLFSAFLLTFSAVAVVAQRSDNTSKIETIVVFGDSLSDTGNVAHLTQAKYGFRVPGPAADYTDGRFTDGADTLPAAEKYFGVWIEQYAASLPAKPAVKDSLDGGTDYAYGFATTGSGTGIFAFGTSNEFSVNVVNIGQQISEYLATKPKITDKTLFVVWGGANDLLQATSENDIIDAGINQAINIQTLIDAGATHFIIPNLPPLGLVPRLNGSPTTSVPATEASELYNEVLRLAITVIHDFNRGKRLELAQLDVFSLFNKIVASPSKYSFVNVTASSQGEPVDPDTYLFWDDLHPTTRGHNILATSAAKLLDKLWCHDDAVTAGKDLPDLKTNGSGKFAAEPTGAVH